MFEVFEGVCIPVPFFLNLGKGSIDGNYGDEQRTVCTICSANDVSPCYLNVTFPLSSVFNTHLNSTQHILRIKPWMQSRFSFFFFLNMSLKIL